ncbi:protein tyrosine kinase [Ostertagia ostertagi]
MVIDSCNSTGTQPIRNEKCWLRGHRHGPYQYLSVDDQQQIWTVPETLLYRCVLNNSPAGGLQNGKLSLKSSVHPHKQAGISVSSPSNPMWSCGGFPNIGGVAVPCEPVAGGGGGYYGRQGYRISHGTLVGDISRWPSYDAKSRFWWNELACPTDAQMPAAFNVRRDRPASSQILTLPTIWNVCASSVKQCLLLAPALSLVVGEIWGNSIHSYVVSLLIRRKWAVMALFICTSLLLAGLVRCARRCAKRRPTAADQIKLLVMKSDYKDIDIGEPYWDQIASLPCLPWDDIAIGREIGTGAFGNVHEGRTADGQIFAVKTICMNKSTSAEAQREFAFEALFMHKFNHPNIVRLHWIQWDPPRLRIILEFMGGGDLRSFLREARPTQDDLNPYDLRILNLIEIALDIARGCQELNRQKYIHRDLAARNCLLTEKGPNRRVKIGDFGMARDIYENNYYRKGGRAKLPVRWMPPEAFLDGLFTTQTDVWSFGVVLWEISSFGMLPYFGVDNFDVMGLVTSGGRLDPPNTVPIELHDLMRSCWNTRAENRPSFTEIVAILELLSQRQEIVDMPINCFTPLPSTLVSPVGNSTPAMPLPSPSIVGTPCTAVTALSPGTPETTTGFGISMSGVPYTPINSEALRELHAEKSMRNDPAAVSDSGLTSGNIFDSIATVKDALFGNRVSDSGFQMKSACCL